MERGEIKEVPVRPTIAVLTSKENRFQAIVGGSRSRWFDTREEAIHEVVEWLEWEAYLWKRRLDVLAKEG